MSGAYRIGEAEGFSGFSRAIREVVGGSVGNRVPQTLVIDVRRGSRIVPFQ